ncbi:hypothetical protein LIS04_67 [Listeria phage LIS04]|nr:hypothetical protein LIS04_67 [Listeria phage LIS04]
MSLRLYTEALLAKFRGVFENTVIAQPDNFFEVLQKYQVSNNDSKEPKLPAISIYRTSASLESVAGNFSGVHTGRSTNYPTPDKTTIHNVVTTPLRLEFLVEVWCKSRTTCDDLVSELVLWLKRDPNISFAIPKTDELQHYSVAILGEIIDNTELSDFENQGRLYRSTLTLVIDNAQLFNTYTKKTVLSSDVKIHDHMEE